jgi:hypothetical protein
MKQEPLDLRYLRGLARRADVSHHDMGGRMKLLQPIVIGLLLWMAAGTAHAIDNSSLSKPEFREHKATYGVVYKLPK